MRNFLQYKQTFVFKAIEALLKRIIYLQMKVINFHYKNTYNQYVVTDKFLSKKKKMNYLRMEDKIWNFFSGSTKHAF